MTDDAAYDPAFPKPEPKPKGGKERHERGCNCRSCINRRNRANGRRRQKKIASKLGVAGAHEEQWRHPLFRVEVKSGGQVPKKVLDAFAQSQRAKSEGDPRPGMTVWVPVNSPRAIAILALDDLNAALENQGPSNTYALRDILRKIKALADDAEGLAR